MKMLVYSQPGIPLRMVAHWMAACTFFLLAALVPFQADSAKQGSGVAVSAQGHILTNRHVIAGCKDVAVQASRYLPGIQRFRRAEVVAVSEREDLAVIRADLRPDAPYAPILVAPNYYVIVPTTDTRLVHGGFPTRPGLSPDSPFHGRVQITYVKVRPLPELTAERPHTRVMAAATNHGGSGSGVFDMNGNILGLVYAILPDEGMQALQEVGRWPEIPLGRPTLFYTLTRIARFLTEAHVPFAFQRTDNERPMPGPVHGFVIQVVYKVVCQ